MKFTVLLWISFSLLSGCAETPCGKAKLSLEAKGRAIDTCVSSDLCRPTLADFEEAFTLLQRVEQFCGKVP